MANREPMDIALEWIGFTIDAQRIAISENVADFADMADLKGKDISDLANWFICDPALDQARTLLNIASRQTWSF